ncbi:MAG: hypothetical protein HFI11_04345 [Lachnospiraceae bacterium]|nr:hypothetical protein [Lachnospiraceae bacterium]
MLEKARLSINNGMENSTGYAAHKTICRCRAAVGRLSGNVRGRVCAGLE